MKYKKGDIIKIKNYEVRGTFGQLDPAFLGKIGVLRKDVKITPYENFQVEILGSGQIVYLEEQEIQCKIKDNKLNRKLYNCWD